MSFRSHKVVDTLLRAVGIVDLQAVALRHHVVTHLSQGLGSLLGQQGRRLLVAVDAGTYEIVRAEVAYLKDGIGHGISQGDKLAAVIGSTDDSGLFLRGFPPATGGGPCAADHGEDNQSSEADGGQHPSV